MSAVSGCGVGLRREHFDVVLQNKPAVPWFEVISENFMLPGGRPRHALERVRRDYPVALHGVSLSLGSAEPVQADYLSRLRALADRVEPAIVSDHLCWTSLGGRNSHDLLPLPFSTEAVRIVARKIRRVQDSLGRRILVENVSTYLRCADAEMEEWEFLTAVAEAADCHVLLDVNNVYVNARNHGFDALRYLRGLPVTRVAQFHLAGHEDHGHVVVDTHDRPVCPAVWDLYRAAVARFGPLPTLIERDADVPEWDVLEAEARQAQAVLTSAMAGA